MPILTEFPEIIEKHSQMQRKQEDLSSIREFKKKTDLVSKCLDNLLLFCNNKLKSMITVDKQFGHVVALRQKILREQLFIDALADILNNLFVGNFHLAKITALNRQESEPEILVKKSKDLSTEITKTQLQVILSISKKIYALLEMICKGNKENQNYSFKFIKVFQKHAAYGVGATKTIMSILDENESLLFQLHKAQGLSSDRNNDSIIGHYA